MPSITVRSLGGEITVDLPEGATFNQLRDAAGVAAGTVFRVDGQRQEDSAPVQSDTVIAAPPEAKHGFTIFAN